VGVRRIYADTMIVMPFLTGAFVVLVASSYDRLLTVWIGHAVPQVGPILFILLTGNITAVVLAGVGSSLCKGIGRVSLETTYIVICVVANVVLKLVLTPWLGPIGTVLSSAASWALGSIIFVIMLHRAVELPNAALRAAAMLPMMAITVVITREAVTFMPASTTRGHAALAGTEIGLFSIVLFVVLLAATRILPWATLRRVGAELRAFLLARLGGRYAF
jgi:hypothetical protein